MLNLRMCVFIWRLGRWVSSDYNDSVFCKEETSTAIGMIKEKKRLMCKTEKKSKDKKSSKIQPAPVLVRMLWGRFRTRSDSIGHARGRFRTWADSIGRASQRPWTRQDEWPDPVRSRQASDTFPDPSPESDSSRFVRSLNLPNDLNYTYQNQTLSSRSSFWVLCESFLSFPSFSFCLKLNHFVGVSPSTSSLSWASVFSISLRSPWLLSHLLSELFVSASALIWHRHFLECIHFSHSNLKYRKFVYKSRTWLDAALE